MLVNLELYKNAWFYDKQLSFMKDKYRRDQTGTFSAHG